MARAVEPGILDRWRGPSRSRSSGVDLEAVRADVLPKCEGLSQAQADWKPGEKDWSVGEIVHHLTIAEIATGKLTTKLTREAEAAGTLKPFPADLRAFARWSPTPRRDAEAPPVVWPEHGKPIGDARRRHEGHARAEPPVDREARRPSIRARSCSSTSALGDLDLSQWWQLQAAARRRSTCARSATSRPQPGFPGR